MACDSSPDGRSSSPSSVSSGLVETPALSKEQRRGGPRVACRPLLRFVQLSSARARQAVRQDCSFPKKQESPPSAPGRRPFRSSDEASVSRSSIGAIAVRPPPVCPATTKAPTRVPALWRPALRSAHRLINGRPLLSAPTERLGGEACVEIVRRFREGGSSWGEVVGLARASPDRGDIRRSQLADLARSRPDYRG